MLSLLSSVFLSIAQAEQPIRQEWLQGANELTPYGRLQVALATYDSAPNNDTLLELGNTHPHIAVMLVEPATKMALEYLVTIPSTERHKLRKSDSIIRKFDSMDKAEKKQAIAIAKSLGLSKKLVAIRVGSFNGIDIAMEISYKHQGTTKRKTITLAQPFTPEFAQQSRNILEEAIGTKPLPPTTGQYSLMPFENASFELRFREWDKGVGFRFENPEPVGTASVDEDIFMDGKTSVRFYNTEETMVFPNLSQEIPVGDTYKVRFQTFVQAKNARVEYRQDATQTKIVLDYLDSNGASIKSDVHEVRLGTYDWESVSIDSFVPEDATSLRLTLGSSISGALWFDGCSLIRME